MPFHTLDDLPGENDPAIHGPVAGRNQDQAHRPAHDPFPGIGHRLQEHGRSAAPQVPEHRGHRSRRGRIGLNGARRAQARSASCDTCGHGGSESDDEWDGGHELVLLLPDGGARDLMQFDVWSGFEGGDGEALAIMAIDGDGDGDGGDQPPAYERVQGPAGPGGRGLEHQGGRGVEGPRRGRGRRQRSESRGTYSSDSMWSSASEDRHMYRRRRAGGRRRGAPLRHGGEGEGEGEADHDGIGVGPADDWVDGRRGRDDDYGRAMDLFRRAMRDFQG